MKIKYEVAQQKIIAFEIGGDAILRYQGRLVFPDVDGLQERILIEAHEFRYTVHPSLTQMYHDLKKI